MGSKYKDLHEWNNILKGEDPIFILGNGPSIKDVDLSLLDPYFTLGINRIFYDYLPTVLFWQDVSVWRENCMNIIKADTIKVTRAGMPQPKLHRDFLYFKIYGDRKSVYPDRCIAEMVVGKNITSNIATQFAESLAPSCIVFLGIDCQYRDGQTDYYGDNPHHTPDMIERCKEVSEWAKAHCKVPIYNCGLNTCWRQRRLEDVIEKIDAPQRSKEYFEQLFLQG